MPQFPSSIEALRAEDPLFVSRHASKSFQSVAGSESEYVDGKFWRVASGRDHPLGNMALLMEDQNAEEVWKAITPFEGFPSCVRCATSPSQQVAELLEQKGFRLQFVLPAMAVHVDSLSETALPDGYRFERLSFQNSALIRQTLKNVFNSPEFFTNWMLPTATSKHGRPDDPVQWFGVWNEERLVSVSILSLIEGVAGLYAVATMPEERGKGLGAHVTAQPLRIARELGYQIGVLQASESGLSVYKRLGFSVVGEAHQYVRRAPPGPNGP